MRQTTWILLFVLACTAFAAWFFATHEKVTRDEFTGYQGEARVNDFLAAELLLSRVGIEADSKSSLTPSSWLPETTDTLISRSSTTFAIEEERDLLVGWVAQGGHLVLLPPQEQSQLVEELLGYMGFRLVEVARDDEARLAEDEDGADEEESYSYLVDLDNTRYRIDVSETSALGATLSDEEGVVAARRAWHDGFITVIANSGYFTNDAIGQSDHARLLLDAVAGYVDPGKVWFIYQAAFPPLWRVVWIALPYAVISFAAVLACWLWSIMPKFGPAISPEPPVRRSIVEHVRAAGHFVWRNHGAGALSASSASAILHEAEARHPGINRLSVQAQARSIARMTGLPAQSILEVLTNRDETRHRQFTHDMQALQRIRKEL